MKFYNATKNGNTIIFPADFLEHFRNAEYIGEFENTQEAQKEFEWREKRKNAVYCYLGNMYKVYKFSGKNALLWDMNTGEELKVTTEHIRNSGKFEICVKLSSEWHGIGYEH